jgi:predicted amidophosphoribosyltransferase
MWDKIKVEERRSSVFCSQCRAHIEDGAHFCQNCGASLRSPGGSVAQPTPRSAGRPARAQDPYKGQIDQLKLEIRQLKLDLKHITTQMSSIRSQYHETSAFVPRGLLKWGDKALEDLRLLGPQQQKERLQQEIMQLEQELLGLQQAQAQWKAQQ